MDMYSHYYQEVACNSTTWAHPDADRCGCHGSGWWCSDVDTWHKCPYHKPDAPHPECDIYDEDAPVVDPPTMVDEDGCPLDGPEYANDPPPPWADDDIPF